MIPRDFSLPSKFQDWRVLKKKPLYTQLDLAMDLVASPERFKILTAPTGDGKTLSYMIAALTHQMAQDEGQEFRTLILTGNNRRLQRQLMGDFSSLGLQLIEGAGNYVCNDAPTKRCSYGKCTIGEICSLRNSGCDYYDQREMVRNSSLVNSNLSYSASMARYSDHEKALGQFDLLIVDEAHILFDWLSDFCSVRMDRRPVKALINMTLPKATDATKLWATWAGKAYQACRDRYEELRNSMVPDKKAIMRELVSLGPELQTLASIQLDEKWIHQQERFGVKLTPVDPTRFMERYVFLDIPNVLLVSAGITAYHAKLFNLAEQGNYSMHQGGEGFDPLRRPIYYKPAIKVNWRMTYAHKQSWVSDIDAFMAPRIDRWKGIISSVSYKRAEEIQSLSRFGHHMLLYNDSKDFDRKLTQFMEAKAPCAFIGPSFAEGLDLEGDLCRWNVVAKMDFLNPSDPLIQERKKKFKGYMTRYAAEKALQKIGRSNRSKDDWSESAVTDHAWTYVRHHESLPAWFKLGQVWCENWPTPLGDRL